MNINRIIRWVIDNFFILVLAVYSLLYARWFVVSPIDDSSVDLGTFAFGLGLLIFLAILLTLRHIFVRHNTLRLIFSTTSILSLALTGLYLLSFMPQLEQVASFNGNIYFLTYHQEFLGNGESRPLLAKWDSKLHHSVSGLGDTCCTLRLTYDPLLHVVSVVQILGSTQTLAYADSDPPRFYERDTQFGNYRYYPAWDCYASAAALNSVCDVFIYTVYRCTLENTNCIQLPFHYSGDYAFDIAMSQDEQTHEINIYFWIGEYPGVETLIFTYSESSHCHVAECQLLTSK